MAKYANYKSNLEVLRRAPEQDLENEFVQSGVIDKFSLQFELAWKLLRKTLEHEGMLDAPTGSPRGVIKSAYAVYDFIDEDLWLQMLADRNAAGHVYDSEMARRLIAHIIDDYIFVFDALLDNLESLYNAELLESF